MMGNVYYSNQMLFMTEMAVEVDSNVGRQK